MKQAFEFRARLSWQAVRCSKCHNRKDQRLPRLLIQSPWIPFGEKFSRMEESQIMVTEREV